MVIHFAGDSGDGMQVAGMQLTQSSASMGNDVRTFSDFQQKSERQQVLCRESPAFNSSFSQRNIYTAGDRYDVLIAMNPAALKMTLPHLKVGGI